MLEHPVAFNLGDLGHPIWVRPQPWLMRQIWHGADDLFTQPQAHAADIARVFIDEHTQRLRCAALAQEPTDEWIMNALLVLALRALVDGEVPEHHWCQE